MVERSNFEGNRNFAAMESQTGFFAVGHKMECAKLGEVEGGKTGNGAK